MRTLISADWYKLLQGKVLLLILAGVTAQTLLFRSMKQAAMSGEPPVHGQLGVLFLGDTAIFLQVWILAFVGYFVASEFQNGTMRNTLALGKNRIPVYLSKLLSSFIATAAIFAIVTIASTAWLSVTSGFGTMPFNEFLNFLALNFSMMLLYHLAFAAIFTMFAFISKNVGMTILMGSGFWIAKMYLPMVLAKFGFASAIEYMPDYYISLFRDLSGNPDFITRGITVSLAYIVITSIIGIIVFKKSDIK